jgi:hypothetical protein
MISILFTRPLKGAALFTIGHLLGTLCLIYTSSRFASVAILSLILRSLIVIILAYLYEKEVVTNILALLASIVLIENFLAYSIALLYYGYDAIEVGLDIYSAVYIPFIYLSHKYYREGYSIYSISIITSMILYYFSSIYFYAFSLNILSMLILLYFMKPLNYEKTKKMLYILPLIFIILLPTASTPLAYNLKLSLYPYSLSTISGKQWIQTNSGDHCLQGNVFQYVYDPARLRIMDTCVTVEGVVVSNIHKYADGDICFDVAIEPEYNNMLSIGSMVLRHGAIHVEIVPHDQGTVVVPKKGDFVKIIGAWVIDTDHGSYSEIHPAWYIEIIKSNATS